MDWKLGVDKDRVVVWEAAVWVELGWQSGALESGLEVVRSLQDYWSGAAGAYWWAEAMQWDRSTSL
jgi:hypothetical protein